MELNHSGRDHARLSPSSAHRWLACPPSAVAAELYSDKGSPYAYEGTLAHEIAEYVVSGTPVSLDDSSVRDAGATEDMMKCAQGYRDYIQELTSADAEVLLEKMVSFADWVPDGYGTCDCIIINEDTMHVIDYKYGKGVEVSAKNNPQTRLYALGALHDYGWLYDVQKIICHIYQPRLNNISREELTTQELMGWAEKEVKPTAAQASRGEGEYHAGAHCRFCPHAGKCKALQQTCMGYVEHKDFTRPIPLVTAPELADTLALAPLIRLWLDRAEGEAMQRLRHGESVPGYKLVAGRAGRRKWTDEHQVVELLTNAAYRPEQYTKTELLSPTAMVKALGKKTVQELLSDLIEQPPGNPVIAPETDKRPAYDPLEQAQKDFE